MYRLALSFLLLLLQVCLVCGHVASSLQRHSGSAVGRQSDDRQLVWGHLDARDCSTTIVQTIEEQNQVVLSFCFTGIIVWDPTNILQLSWTYYSELVNVPGDSFYTGPGVFYSAYYTGGGEYSLLCSFAGGCSWDDGSSSYSMNDHYAYDCSNVYCGPRAIRSCNGEYQDVPCTSGLISSPAIPAHEQVECEKSRGNWVATQSDTCTPCTLMEASDGTSYYSYVCTKTCTDCFSGGRSLSESIRRFEKRFFGVGTALVQCVTLNNGQDEDCWQINYGPVVYQSIEGELVYFYASTNCMSWWNNIQCECTVTGYDDQQAPLIRKDCSEAAGVPNSVADGSSSTYTGVFSDYANYNGGFDTAATPLDEDAAIPESIFDASSPADSSSTTSFLDCRVGYIMLGAVVVALKF